jgi:hypothetical protein
MNEEIGSAGELYHHYFHYNHYRDMWFAIPRDQIVDYWNGTCSDCIAHSDIGELLRLVFEKYHEEK